MKTTLTKNQIFRNFCRLQRSCWSTVFLLTFLLVASSSWGQVSTLQNWSNVYQNNSTSQRTVAYAVPAGTGTNRVLAVAIASSQTAVGSRTVSIAYGGQTMTLAGGDMGTTTTRQHTAIYYLNEAGLDAASNTNLVFTVSGGTTRITTVWAAVFDQVDQTTTIRTARNYNSIAANTSTLVFATALTINANDQAVLVASSVRNNNTAERTFTPASNFTSIDQQTWTSTDGVRNAMFNRSIPTANTTSTCSTDISGSALGSMTGVSFIGCGTLPTANAGSALTAICQGGVSAALGGSVGGGANGGTWSSSVAGGTFSPNETTLNATYTPPSGYTGTATLTLTSSGGSCGAAIASKNLLVNPSPTAVTAAPSATSICSGGSFNLASSATSNSATTTTLLTQNFNGTPTGWTTTNTSTNGTTVLADWTLRANGYNDGNETFNSNDASQFYMSSSDAQGIGSTTATTLKSPSFSTVGMSASSLTFYHYYRYNSGTESAKVEISTDGTNYTTLTTYTSTQGAASTFTPVTISLASYLNQPTVHIRFKYDASFDWYWLIDNVSVSATYSSTAATFAWTSTPSGYTSTSQNPTSVSPTVATTYTVTATNKYGCSSATSTNVFVKALPVVTATPSVTAICSGGSLNLSSSATSNSASATTLLTQNFNGTPTGWTTTNTSTLGIPANAAWTLVANGYTEGSETINSNDSSQFYISSSDAQGTGSTTATTLKSPSFSTLGMSAASLTFYQYYKDYDSTDSAIVEISTNGTSWTALETFTSTQGTSSGFVLVTSPLTAYLGQGTVHIRFRYDAVWAFHWAIDNVTVTSTPATPAITYAWTSTPAGFTSTTQNPTGVSPTVATTYKVTVTNNYGCTANSTTSSVAINALPSVPTITVTAPTCASAATNILSTYSASLTYTSTPVGLSVGAGGVITGGTNGTSYTIKATNSNSCFATSASFTYNGGAILASPTLTVSPNQSICAGSNATITVSGASSYLWNNSAGTGSSVSVSPSTTTTYQVTGTAANGCTNTATTTVTVNSIQIVSVSIEASSTTICPSALVTFNATPTNGGTTPSYQWKVNGSNVGSNSATFTSTTLANGNAVTCVMTSNANVCLSGSPATSNSITINVNTSIGITAITAANNPIAPSQTTTITATGVVGTGAVVSWYSGASQTGLLGTGLTSPAVSPGTYYAVVTGTCGSAIQLVTTINPLSNWTGAINTLWHVAGNWAENVLPNASSYVVIGDGKVAQISSADVSANVITINGSGTLTVQSGRTLTVTNSINTTSATQFVLENNANLLQGGTANQNVGPITVKRNSSSIIRLDYTLWSSPVASQGLYAFSKTTLPSRFYKYDTNTNLYTNSVGFNLINLQYPSPLVAPNGINGTDDNNITFATGKGYLIRMPWDHPTAPTTWTGNFTGVPNNGNITYTMSDFGATKRFNLVGNPYPSPISISQFILDNETNITSSIYFWRKTNGSTSDTYCEWNDEIFTDNNDSQSFDPGDTIRTGQGFFVEATGVSNTLVFNNGQRVNNTSNQFFRPSATNSLSNQNAFWLNLTGSNAQFSQTAVTYKSYATNGLDRYDAKRISPGTISLTSMVEGNNLAIQSKSDFVNTDVVPLSYVVATAGSYSITIDNKIGIFSTGQIIYLKDRLLNVDFNLALGSYTFVSEVGTFNNRFEIVYQTSSLAVTNPIFNESQVVIFKSRSNEISINTGNFVMSSVKIFDISGRLLFEKKDIDASQTLLNIGLATEVLLVQITSNEGVVVTKKVLFPRTSLKLDKKIEVKTQLAEDE